MLIQMLKKGEREEWMYVADLKMKSDNGNCKLIKCPLDYNEDRLKYTVEEIGDMPYWRDTQKKAGTLQIPSNSEPVKTENFNNEQRVAYQIVQNHFKSKGQKQLLMIITGLGGSGKSYVIQALSELLDTQCKVCAFFGIAAFNIKGRTLHSLLQLPIKGRNNGPLKASALAKLQQELDGVRYLIIDEFSVIGQRMFAWINRRCKDATGCITNPFGGISIILVGDIGQLPPITDQVLYYNKPQSDLAIEGYYMYREFTTVVKFKTNERGKGADAQQEIFRALQIRVRDGNSTIED